MKTANKTSDEQEIELETAGLCLRFARAGDRFQLRLLVDGVTLLEASAGADNEAWPSAPPLQQLHEQVLPTGPVVLGVGSAGTTHWSASFAVRTPGVIWCEYAARVSRAWEASSQWLGTTFRSDEGWEWSSAGNELILGNSRQTVSFRALGPETQLNLNSPSVLAATPANDFAQVSNTIQWRLAICLRS